MSFFNNLFEDDKDKEDTTFGLVETFTGNESACPDMSLKHVITACI